MNALDGILDTLNRLTKRISRLEAQNAPRFIPLTTVLSSTSWDFSVAYSTTAKTLIDLSAVFGVPAGIKAVLMYVGARDSGSAGTDCWVILSSNNTAYYGMAFNCVSINDRINRESIIVPCNADGDIYYQCAASGSGTLDILLQVFGYWI